jgi:glutamyl-tRNA synthetase
MTVVTRFAPSPTGFLHIGGARTALFNWLYARHHGGIFHLRIEDTDRVRSTDAAIEAIIDGLKWLGLTWDGEITYQFARAPRHAEVALQLLEAGKAYRCYCSPEELDEMRKAAQAAGKPMKYDGRWRDRDPKDAPAGVKPVIRLKAPQQGETIVVDGVQGEVRVSNEQLDDMILLRSDGTPTYMLSVVVDDHDMDITHVIRGDDHLTNTFRQRQIYDSMGWEAPHFSHIPLIHGPDGAKLSKRHGALGVEAYRDMGYLPEALRNYLLRLGWGHGDDEIISTAQAIEWFELSGIGRSPSRFDFAKLDNLNGHYMRQADDAGLAKAVAERLGKADDAATLAILTRAMPGLKSRAKTLKDLAENAGFYVQQRPLTFVDKAKAMLVTPETVALMPKIIEAYAAATDWQATSLEEKARSFAEAAGVKLGAVAQPLRAALTGSTQSPPIFEVMEILGKDEAMARLREAPKA